jgi:hypothetical protein
MKKLLVFLIVLAMVPMVFAGFKAAVGDASNYCDCDEKCSAEDSQLRCLSMESPAMFLDSDAVVAKVEAANAKGYNGVCAYPTMDTEKVNFQLTPSCAKQSVHINAAQDEDEPVVNDTAVVDDVENESDDGGSGNLITGNVVNDTTDDNDTVVNQSDEEVQGVLQQIEQKQQESVNDKKEDLKVEDDSMSTNLLAAVTIIVIALFVLIGWIAYLHYRR